MTKANKSNFKDLIKNGSCVVDMGAPWCPDCRKIEPIMNVLESEYKNVNFIYLDFDENEELKSELGIRRIPTLIFYKNGVEVGERLVEPGSKVEIENAIKAVL